MQVWRKSIHWFIEYSTYKTMTLKMRSRSPKLYQLLSLSLWYIENPSTSSKYIMTLKMRSRSPKSNQLLSLSQWFIQENLVEFHELVYEILWVQEFVTLGTRICHLNPPMTLKMRSRSPKPNQLLSLSQWYIQANLMEFHQLVQEISWVYKKLSRTQTPTILALKPICTPPPPPPPPPPSPLMGRDIIMNPMKDVEGVVVAVSRLWMDKV